MLSFLNRNHFGSQPDIKPLVGVFVSLSVIRKLKKQSFIYKINELCQANMEVGVDLYFFSKKDADLNKKRIKGTYFCTKTGKWTQKNFPFPDVLYYRRSDGKKSVQAFRDKLKEYGVLFLNPVADFDKWDVYNRLVQQTDMVKHLPLTIQYKQIESLNDMFNQCDRIYIKPCKGRYSRNVIRVNKKPEGGFVYSYYSNQLVVKNVDTLPELNQRLLEILKGRSAIIQQAIEGETSNQNSITDMRAEVQRNGDGEIEVVATTVRVSDTGSPVTSMRTNASVYSLDNYFKEKLHYSDERLEEIQDKINKFLITIYKGVEDVYGFFGELGIDFVLNNDGELWLIECNAKSAKAALIKSYDKATIRRAFLNPLAYAKYITSK
ncbi:hypothetical protein J2S74_002731 [Evansella vedderi]|uniref:ATP-grasp domain-containing protein n=1 Tax=Evansella vedderi TaxID=38282 RepID=A0ABT9ZVV4_9BACI|nr:YheC/YheD family protein [Evansella vedderi]MDQ0255349.1 hypothetical protein [Evansella vedderi]